MNKLVTGLCTAAVLIGCTNGENSQITDINTLSSPDGKLEMSFHLTGDGTPEYTLDMTAGQSS